MRLLFHRFRTSDPVTLLRGFELGPIRPPSEAHSLLVRVIRNCTWNRCSFLPWSTKGTTSSQRSLEDVLADVDAMAAVAEVLREKEWAAARAGELPEESYQVEIFRRAGETAVFLQDADPCAVKPEKLTAVIRRVKERFPTVDSITTYGRARTLARRAPEQLEMLAEAGLTRLHLGLESVGRGAAGGGQGHDVRRADPAAGTKVMGAGIELCFYLMPGLAGREPAAVAEHVAGSARVIRAVAAAAPVDAAAPGASAHSPVNSSVATHGERRPLSEPLHPLVVRLRTAAVSPGTPLAQRQASGGFELPDDVEVVRELRDLIDQVGEARFELRSDHALNLLPELEGSMPADRPRLLALLDEYLALPRAEQASFAVGARLGVFRRLADLQDHNRRAILASLARRLRARRLYTILARRVARRGARSALALHLAASWHAALSDSYSWHRRQDLAVATLPALRRPASGLDCLPRGQS